MGRMPLVAALVLVAACTSLPDRQQRNPQDLAAARRAEDAERALERRALGDRFLALAEAKGGASIDILIVSGGGDWGAFGAGVLKGWGRVKGELARPRFDIVTGVSTGALIAPFAFLGDEASIERIVGFYRNPQ